MYAKTLMFAAERHKDQKMKDKNVSYIVHLSLVAMELINLFATVKGFDEDYAIQTALLHDVIEIPTRSIRKLKNISGEK
ncbi:MAG TPA: hypothetical protein PKK13_05255 [Spirochaetota bacterium]|nr:hypothetical protein [Spirochaetota bacterium]